MNSLLACEKPEFDRIVKVYLKEIYDFKRIAITDGKDDTGLDIKVFDNGQEKIQYQLTTQKSDTKQEKLAFESKLFSDVKKAQRNHLEYSYSNNLFYFYSKTLTNKTIRDFAKRALSDGINLTLIEANRIAEESEEYIQLQKAIIETNDVKRIIESDKLFPDSEKNLVFDLIGFGKSSDFKLQIVESFVLQEILSSGSLSFDQLSKICKEKFDTGENDVFYEKLVARLQSAKRITKSINGEYVLTSEEENRLNNLKTSYNLDEKKFISGVHNILKEYQQEAKLEEYISQLKTIYTNNFNSDVVSLIDNLKTEDLSGLSRDFLNFIKKNHSGSNEEIKLIAKELFQYCQQDTFLQKFCAGKVFGETSNLSRIETYVNTQKRIFIDTQLALFALCHYYNPKADYPNYFFRITKSLLKFCKQNNIDLFLPDRYLWEVQTHLRDALNLVPFTQLPNFEKLGKSRNVFFNYYLFIKKEDSSIKSFIDFLNKFGFNQYDNYQKHTLLIKKHLNNVGLKVFDLSKNYEIEDTSRLIQEDLIKTNRLKTKFGLNNDAIVLEFLSDVDVDVHPLQPMFLTWDKSFFNVQRIFFKKNPTYGRWFLMTPGKFIDQYSLLQFSITSEVLTSELIAFLSDDIVSGTHTLLDSITFIFSNDEVSLEYANRLGEIRDNEIHRIQEKQVVPPDDMEGEAVIDDVFYKLTNHYQENDSNIENFKRIFSAKDFMERVLKTLIKAIDQVYKSKKFDDSIYAEFDKIISDVKISKN